ncbi:MAG TPA: type IV toxin-antitoxin system AbiEi family antitoxin domain-containing protein [Solirubrobacterales bacterium]|nr:type IV toxin-antitoxin system AbiEi family antitoxin domain-containing protein [Solirubrobacterales bacterium]
MGRERVHNRSGTVWALAARQHGAVSRAQLLELGINDDAIQHRLEIGRLPPVWRGVYAVGRPDLTRRGRWMAAVLCCGPGAALSHRSAAARWRIRAQDPTHREVPVDVSIPAERRRRRDGIRIHRPSQLDVSQLTRCDGVPVTSAARTLIDLGTCLSPGQLEAAVNEADKRDLIDPEELRAIVERSAGMRGVVALRRLLDRATFTLTDSELERRFLLLLRRTACPGPRLNRS